RQVLLRAGGEGERKPSQTESCCHKGADGGRGMGDTPGRMGASGGMHAQGWWIASPSKFVCRRAGGEQISFRAGPEPCRRPRWSLRAAGYNGGENVLYLSALAREMNHVQPLCRGRRGQSRRRRADRT